AAQEAFLAAPFIDNTTFFSLLPATAADIKAPLGEPDAFWASVVKCVGAEQIVGHLVFFGFIAPCSHKFSGPAIGCTETVNGLRLFTNVQGDGCYLFLFRTVIFGFVA